jgi:molybdopterin-guanine dinucleotide biosynthesis protein A/molybdopterin-guanine dinucleotide biosynthesis protein
VLIKTLTRKGYQIAAVCCCSDAPGAEISETDTSLFARAGARATARASDGHIAFFCPERWTAAGASIRRIFQDCHLVLVEGGKQWAGDIIEIVPDGAAQTCAGDGRLKAVVGAGAALHQVPHFGPHDPEAMAAFIEDLYLKPLISTAVMAGGSSRRLGRNKALLALGGATVVEQVIAVVAAFAGPVRIVTAQPDEYQHFGLPTIRDIRPGCGPLSGIHAALCSSSTDYVLIVSCDMPLIGPAQLRPLLGQFPGHDITICKHTRFEPLCAVYRRSCIAALEELINHHEYRIIDLFPTLDVKVIRIENGSCFRSINTEEDYRSICEQFRRPDS